MRYKEFKKKIKKLKETKYNKTYDFRKFNTIHIFGNDVNNNFINMSMANDAQNHLAKQTRKFKNMTRTVIVQWNFLNEGNSCLKHLKVEYF